MKHKKRWIKGLGLSIALGASGAALAATPGIVVAGISNTRPSNVLIGGGRTSAVISIPPENSRNFEMEGSSGRGGGDPLALEFKATAQVMLRNLQPIISRVPFSNIDFTRLQNEVSNAQILISDNELPISHDGVIQNGAAENHPNQNLIILSRQDYSKIGSAALQQALALHEYLSLMGVESTGNYPISGAYLSAVNDVNSGNSSQTVASVAMSAETQSCSKPNPDTAMLFSMIANSETSATAVQSFLTNHLIAADALDDQCKTSFDEAIDGTRVDVLKVLLAHYLPNLSDSFEDFHRDSIYGYGLSNGTSAVLQFIKTWAGSHQQTLSLKTAYFEGETELMRAASNSSPEMLQYVLKNGGSRQVNAEDSEGWSALMYAARYNPNVTIIQLLIQAGANVNEDGPDNITALMYAAGFNPSLAAIQTLINSGANINATDSDGLNALKWAADYNTNPAVVQELIQAGAAVNATDANGVTALMLAAYNNPSEAVTEALIQGGANIDATDAEGNSPLIIAMHHNSNPAVAQALIRAGATANAKEPNGRSMLMNAVESNTEASVVRALIQGGANVNEVDETHTTVLMKAVSNDAKLDVVQALIQGGANVNAENDSDWTALKYTFESNVDLTVIQALILAGADVNQESGSETPLKSAVFPYHNGEFQESRQDQIIEMLIQAGADVSKDDYSAFHSALALNAPSSMLKLLKPAQPHT
jgi:uncharacterized protein